MNKNFSIPTFSLSASNAKYYLILFLLWPFLAFLTALADFSRKESKKVVYIFFIYFGLNLVIGNEGYVDAAGYAMGLKANAALPFSDFFKIVGGLYTTETSVDIVEPLISFFVSRFTDDHRILFAFYAAIFGFFYLKSINLLYNRYRENPGWNVAIHMAFFAVILTITSINGFRMWTAAWIFFYGAYHVVLYHDARYLLIALGASFVHWSFLSANVILIAYFFAGNLNFVYMPLALASFVVPQIIAPLLQKVSMSLGGPLQGRYESYSNEAYVLTRQEDFEQASWFLQLSNGLVLYYLLFAIIFIQLRFSTLMKDKDERNLFSFLLLLLSFVNFGRDIPSFGERFQIVFFLFATLYVFLFFMKRPGNIINPLTLIGLLPMALYAVIVLRQGSESINAWMLTPVLGLPWFVPPLSIAEILFR